MASKSRLAESPKGKPKVVRRADDFESVARRFECDEDKERFEANLGEIAKGKPAKKGGR